MLLMLWSYNHCLASICDCFILSRAFSEVQLLLLTIPKLPSTFWRCSVPIVIFISLIMTFSKRLTFIYFYFPFLLYLSIVFYLSYCSKVISIYHQLLFKLYRKIILSLHISKQTLQYIYFVIRHFVWEDNFAAHMSTIP